MTGYSRCSQGYGTVGVYDRWTGGEFLIGSDVAKSDVVTWQRIESETSRDLRYFRFPKESSNVSSNVSETLFCFEIK